MLKQGERGSLDGRRDRWQAAAVGGGAAEREREEEEKRYSAKSAPSDDDWEMVTDSGYHQEGRVPVKVGGVLGQAGDWLQWGIDGAAKSVENTYDGLSGLLNYKKLQKQRREALELASRQQWQLMHLQTDRNKEREEMERAERERAKEIERHLAHLNLMKKERDAAQANWRQQSHALQSQTGRFKEKEEEVERLRVDAEKLAMQEAAALSALEELREKHQQQQEEASRKVVQMAERERELRDEQQQQQAQIHALKEKLLEMEEATRHLANNGGDDNDELPDEFYCPITMEVMTDPVLAADGFSYERAAIRDWLDKEHVTSPKTGAALENKALHPNLSLRSLIQDRLMRKKEREVARGWDGERGGGDVPDL